MLHHNPLIQPPSFPKFLSLSLYFSLKFCNPVIMSLFLPHPCNYAVGCNETFL
jgi:hypothetical protein